MPSMSESRRQVEDRLHASSNTVDHEAVLASLQEEIDKHNGFQEDFKRSMRDSKRDCAERSQHLSPHTAKFRFKQSVESPKDGGRHRSRHRGEPSRRHRKRRRREYPTPPEEEEEEAAHPFPREPTDPNTHGHGTDDAAFRESLFDALADDEGAAYWESVYSQPIHVYTRPAVRTEKGELEQMSDEEYTAYVKAKMWEKKHPEAMLERERSERRRREEEGEQTRRREEFVRRREQAAWERERKRTFAHNSEGDSDVEPGHRSRYKYEFAGEKEWSTSKPSASDPPRQEYADAWSRYLAAWDKLKHELLSERQGDDAGSIVKPSHRIPWPVPASKPVIKANIEDFMHHAPTDEERSMAQLLKAERVRWHPDKVQQRFGGAVEEGTMKVVTGVFQVVDSLLGDARGREGAAQ